MATKIDVREWLKLTYMDPELLLPSFIAFARSPDLTEDRLIEPRRSGPYKTRHELKLGAIFFFLLSHARKQKIVFAHVERKDYDFVGYCNDGGNHRFLPMQLKELVPNDLNARDSVAELLTRIREKYVDSRDLTIAIAMNRICDTDLSTLDFGELNIKGLWLYGIGDPDRQTWTIIGDLVKDNWRAVEFRAPLE